jgi:hypothetical protein
MPRLSSEEESGNGLAKLDHPLTWFALFKDNDASYGQIAMDTPVTITIVSKEWRDIHGTSVRSQERAKATFTVLQYFFCTCIRYRAFFI